MNLQMIPAEVWLQIGQLLVDLLKTVIPFSIILLIFWIIRDEIKILLRTRAVKVSVLGSSFETFPNQKEEVAAAEKTVVAINNTVKTSELNVKKLKESTEKDNAFLLYHFEKTYRLLFPSQMMILNIMINSNNQIEDFLAKAHFRRTIWAVELNISYDDFMNFLLQSGLIVHDLENNIFTLTPLGKLFWNYLKDEKIPIKNFKEDIFLPRST